MLQINRPCGVWRPRLQGGYVLQWRLSVAMLHVLLHLLNILVLPSQLWEIFENMHKPAISDDFLKWGSLGFHRTLSFATGFTPLHLKPLEEIIDVQRVKNKSSEELADIWDDVISLNLSLGKGPYWCINESKSVPFGGAQSSRLTLFCDSLVERKRIQQCLCKFKCHTCFSLVLKSIKREEPKPLRTFQFHATQNLQTAKTWLTRGNAVLPSKLSDSEAKWLLETAHSFYLNDQRYKLVQRFNIKTREFEFKDVLKALDLPIM